LYVGGLRGGGGMGVGVGVWGGCVFVGTWV
jgi:hypothetical protein